jgi:hypothetical protein
VAGGQIERRMRLGWQESKGQKNQYFKCKTRSFLRSTYFQLLSQINEN